MKSERRREKVIGKGRRAERRQGRIGQRLGGVLSCEKSDLKMRGDDVQKLTAKLTKKVIQISDTASEAFITSGFVDFAPPLL